ncbi:MAG: KEOPS complex subunit Pcc1 [Candidatus Aenigmatarchaeota archaeon]
MRAEIDIPCKNPDNVLKAIEPDMEESPKFSASMDASKSGLLVKVEAKDISGLLTGVNSCLKLVKTATEVDDVE